MNAPSHAHMYQKRVGIYKHSSLLHHDINYGRKKIYSIVKLARHIKL
jgi:hypothetical protein